MAEPRVINAFATRNVMDTTDKANYRTFVVTDSRGVDIPNCLRIEELLLDGHVVPEYLEEKLALDTTRKNFETVKIKLWDIIEGPNGPMLARSMKSNDGVWQVGSNVSIKGTWSDDKPGVPPQAAKESVGEQKIPDEPAKK